MNNDSPMVAAAPRSSTIHDGMSRLKEIAELTEEALQALMSRLAPLSLEHPAIHPKEMPDSDGSQLGVQIKQLGDLFEHRLRTIGSITESLDL